MPIHPLLARKIVAIMTLAHKHIEGEKPKCLLCGGIGASYKTDRQDFLVLRYVKCQTCGLTFKTVQEIDPAFREPPVPKPEPIRAKPVGKIPKKKRHR